MRFPLRLVFVSLDPGLHPQIDFVEYILALHGAQQVFDQFVMKGRSVSSSAKVAVSPQQMSDTLNNEPNTVGILPKHWKAGDSRYVYTIPNVPVLAITKVEPQGAVKAILTCLQK